VTGLLHVQTRVVLVLQSVCCAEEHSTLHNVIHSTMWGPTFVFIVTGFQKWGPPL